MPFQSCYSGFRFGRRTETLELVQEWVKDVASQTDAGLAGAEIAVGAVGTPDCMLQLDLQFPDIASLERFWHTLPAREHRAWLQRLQVLCPTGLVWVALHVHVAQCDICFTNR